MVALAFTLLVVGHAQPSFGSDITTKDVLLSVRSFERSLSGCANEDEQAVEAILGAGRKLLLRATKSRQTGTRAVQPRNIRRCTVWSENPTEAPFCTSVQKTGPFLSAWFQRTVHGTSIPRTGVDEIKFRESERTRPPQFKCARKFAMAKNEAEAKVASEDPITQFVQSWPLPAAANADNKESNPFHGYYFES